MSYKLIWVKNEFTFSAKQNKSISSVFAVGFEIVYICKAQIINKSEKSISQKKH